MNGIAVGEAWAQPTANPDSATTQTAITVDIEVLDNDVAGSPPIDPDSIQIMDPPDHGELLVQPQTGIVSYVSDSGFEGDDSFTYRVRDTAGYPSNTTTVSITVDPNEAPVIVSFTWEKNITGGYTFHGFVDDEQPTGLSFDFGGVLEGIPYIEDSVWVDSDGYFEVNTPYVNQVPGDATVQVEDNLGQFSNVASTYVNN